MVLYNNQMSNFVGQLLTIQPISNDNETMKKCIVSILIPDCNVCSHSSFKRCKGISKQFCYKNGFQLCFLIGMHYFITN